MRIYSYKEFKGLVSGFPRSGRYLYRGIGGQFRLIPSIAYGGETDTAALIQRAERGLLSHADGYGIDPITTEWLGYKSMNELVRKSQLFNADHTRPPSVLPDDAFFDKVRGYIKEM